MKLLNFQLDKCPETGLERASGQNESNPKLKQPFIDISGYIFSSVGLEFLINMTLSNVESLSLTTHLE